MTRERFNIFTEDRPALREIVGLSGLHLLIAETRRQFECSEESALDMIANWYDSGLEYRIDTPEAMALFSVSHVYPCLVAVLARRADAQKQDEANFQSFHSDNGADETL